MFYLYLEIIQFSISYVASKNRYDASIYATLRMRITYVYYNEKQGLNSSHILLMYYFDVKYEIEIELFQNINKTINK